MRVVVAGSSGLIGTALVRSWERGGHTVIRLVRRAAGTPAERSWDPAATTPDLLAGADVVVNLAGAPIGRRWTARYRRLILDSRVGPAHALATMCARADHPPRVYLCASGIRFYGIDRGDEVLTEATPGYADGFLPRVAHLWEAATEPAQDAGVRVCRLRFGLVLSRSGGMLARMLPYFRTGLGARIGTGRQFWSYVSLVDAVRAVRHLAEHPGAAGPFNITAPDPVRSGQFTRELAGLLGRPAALRMPVPALRLVMGGVSEEAVGSLRVHPDRLLATGFGHAHPELGGALRSALQ